MKRIILTEAKLKMLMTEMNFSQDMVFVSYLPRKYNRNEFEEPGRLYCDKWNKNYGGLWACPLDSNRSWKEYCKSHPDLNIDNIIAFYFTLKPNANIYVIDTLEDLEKISTEPYQYWTNSSDFIRRIDYKKFLSSGYDGVYVSENAIENLTGEMETTTDNNGKEKYRYGYLNTIPGTNGLMGLSGWDVESLCVFNPDVIVPISEGYADDINYNTFGDVKNIPGKGLQSDVLDVDDDGAYYGIEWDKDWQKDVSWDLSGAYDGMNYKNQPTKEYLAAKKYDDINKAWKEHDRQKQ